MPSKPRNIQSENYYHAYNRAANKKRIFHDEENRNFFYSKIIEFKAKTGVLILAFSILYTHYHFLLKEPTNKIIEKLKFKGSCQNSISQFIARLNNSYTQYYNRKYGNSGVIWEGRYKSILVDNDNYMTNLIYYINLNAIKHKMVKKIENWDHTSHHDYIYYVKSKSIINQDDLIDFSEYSAEMANYLKNQRAIEEELGKYTYKKK